MQVDRRALLGAGLGMASFGLPASAVAPGGAMYGLIGKMIAKPGERAALVVILTQEIGPMPGCLSYIVANDAADPNAIWVTEVWDSEASHKASLSLPAVRAAIARARPLIAGFGERFTTTPLGGVGLKPAS